VLSGRDRELLRELAWRTAEIAELEEGRISRDLRNGLGVTRANDCVLEIILKDTHTCEHHPERFDRWLEIAREEIERSSR
jgi:hypothetical protein